VNSFNPETTQKGCELLHDLGGPCTQNGILNLMILVGTFLVAILLVIGLSHLIVRVMNKLSDDEVNGLGLLFVGFMAAITFPWSLLLLFGCSSMRNSEKP
jgi:hypothetical protein